MNIIISTVYITLGILILNDILDLSSFFQAAQQDEAVVQILCEWAVSSQRSGEHRAMAVAKLLEKRQNDLVTGEADGPDEKDSVSSANGVLTGLPVFQTLLMKFLDNDAPILGK